MYLSINVKHVFNLRTPFFFSEEHGVEVARKKKKKLMNPEAFKCY